MNANPSSDPDSGEILAGLTPDRQYNHVPRKITRKKMRTSASRKRCADSFRPRRGSSRVEVPSDIEVKSGRREDISI
jgi:hypothetical protein